MKIVFTNGVFDLLHSGHIQLLEYARSLGDYLIVGLNSDESVKKIKGDSRPIICETERKYCLEALKCVDEVIIFSDDTPLKLVQSISPHVFVKGPDWFGRHVAGADHVTKSGGEMICLMVEVSQSTTKIIEKIQNANKA